MPGSARRSGPGGAAPPRVRAGDDDRHAAGRSSAWWAGSVKVRCRAKDASVAGTELARVKRDRVDLTLADTELHAPSGEARIERIVVPVKAEIGLRRDAQHAAQRSGRHRLGEYAHPRFCSSARRSAGTARMPR